VRNSTVVLALGVLLVSCNQRPPVEVDAGSVEQKLYWSRSLQDQRVALEGYINFDNGPDGRAIAGGPELRSSPNGAGEKLLNFAAEFGSGPNQIGSPGMEAHAMFKDAPKGVPDVVTFDPARLTYQDAQGAPHPISQRVRVVGRVRYAVSIENDARSPIGQRFRPFLTHVVLAPAEN
jgi:hypothetical protein